MKNRQVLARQYRPQKFADVIGQMHVVRTLTNALNQNYLHHAYLFTGTRGVGKTSIARILAKCLSCESGITAQPCTHCSSCQEIEGGRFIDLIEVDAASRTKVEDTRELLDNVQYAPTKGRFKIYLIDEVHMLSNHSFNALLKTLEEPPQHVKFLLATTDPQKLPPTVLSRCLQFHLLAMPADQIDQHLQTLLTKENISYETSATRLLAKAAEGSMRDALSLLDQNIAYGNGQILTADTKAMLGTLDHEILYALLQALCQQNANGLIDGVNKLAEQGVDFSRALADLLSLLHQLAVIQAVPQAPIHLIDDKLLPFAQQIGREEVQLYYQIGLLGQRDLSWSPTPQSGFEMTLLRMLAFTPQESTAPPQPIPDASSKAIKPWEHLLKELQLDGVTKMLAEHCGVKTFTDKHLHLLLQPSKQPLLNQKHIDRIREALNKYLGKPMTVEITVESSLLETPADTNRRTLAEQQKNAEQVILSDPIVKKMMATFDATLIKSSVHVKENTN